MRTSILLLAIGGIAAGNLLAQGPYANPIYENTNVVWRTGTAHPITNRWYYPASCDSPDYSNPNTDPNLGGSGVAANTWVYRVFPRHWQAIGGATAPMGDVSRMTGYEAVIRISPATAMGATANLYFPAVLVADATVTPANGSGMPGANIGAMAPDLTNVIYFGAEDSTTVTIGSTQSSGTYVLGYTFVDPMNPMTAIEVDASLGNYTMGLRYHGGDHQELPATGTTFSQGFTQGAYDGTVYSPVDTMNPPAAGTQLPVRPDGFFGYDDSTSTVTAQPSLYLETDSHPVMGLDLDNPTANINADFGREFQPASTMIDGTGAGKHYPQLSTTNATTGVAYDVYAGQFANGVAVPLLNISASIFPGAVQVPLGGPLGSPTFETNIADPLFGAISGVALFFLDANGFGQSPLIPLGATPDPTLLGVNMGVEFALWTANPSDDRWDTSGATWFTIR